MDSIVLSCHAPDSKSSYIKDRFFSQFDEFFGSFPFLPFPVRGRVASIDFIDVDDVDDASEEKVVISEQLWEWFVFVLSSNIDQGSICSSCFWSPTFETPKQICFNFLRKKSSKHLLLSKFFQILFFRQQSAVCFAC